MREDTPTPQFKVASYKTRLTDIGQRVKMARQARGMTQYDLADFIGISSKTISAIEVGRVEPSISQMQALAAVLEEPIGYFVGETSAMVEAKMEKIANELAEIRAAIEIAETKRELLSRSPQAE